MFLKKTIAIIFLNFCKTDHARHTLALARRGLCAVAAPMPGPAAMQADDADTMTEHAEPAAIGAKLGAAIRDMRLAPTPSAESTDSMNDSDGGDDRRRVCHSAAPPSTFRRCFNRHREGV